MNIAAAEEAYRAAVRHKENLERTLEEKKAEYELKSQKRDHGREISSDMTHYFEEQLGLD